MNVSFDILASTTFWATGWWDWLISMGLFLATALGVVSIFGQSGQVQMSPQRAAAIATGHTDRRTSFENPIFRPILWLLLRVAHRLNVPSGKRWLERQLTAAGSPNYYTPEEYLALSFLAGLALGAVLEVVQFLLTGQFSVMAIFLGLVIGVTLSIYQIAERASGRLRDITRQLPYALDLVSLAMSAGATFTEAVSTIIREQPAEDEDQQDPLNMELRALLAEIDLGTTRRQALENLARRVPLTSMRSLVASVIQAEELGTPLSEVLHDQATLLRMQRSVRAENLAASASVRILVPCLLLVMAVILTIFGPAIIRTMTGGLF